MQLNKKKELASKVLKVGKNRINFSSESLGEIKEAITRQDILDLKNAGAITIKEVSGRLKIKKRKHRRGIGKVKKKIKTRKQDYVKLTRKLRTYTKALLKMNNIDKGKYGKIRKMIRASKFRSKRHLTESVGGIE